jgi:hypothetical protein
VPHRHLITTVEEFYSVRPHSGTLTHFHAAGLGKAVLRVSGFPAQIRIVSTTRGQRKLVVHFFYRRVSDLLFDPARLSWTNNVPFLDYSTPKGRDYLRRRHTPLQLTASKWNLVLPPTFDFKWGDVWDPECAKKEAMLLW